MQGASVNWYTPPFIFDKLGVHFDLDVASPQGGVPWIPADRYFSPEDDGLTREWEGIVWMNPPFGRQSKMPDWIDRFVQHRNGIALLPARTDAHWFHRMMKGCDAVCSVEGRIAFIDVHGTPQKGNPVGTVLFACGAACVAALVRCGLGTTVVLGKHAARQGRAQLGGRTSRRLVQTRRNGTPRHNIPRRRSIERKHSRVSRPRRPIRRSSLKLLSRYPGGKQRLGKTIDERINSHFPGFHTAFPLICDAFVGGGGSMLNMALDWPKARFIVNDANRVVAMAWECIWLDKPEDRRWLRRWFSRTKPTVALHRKIFDSKPVSPREALRKMLFLNFTSYNGVIFRCAPLGGAKQNRSKITERYNAEALCERIDAIFDFYAGRIHSVHNEDAATLIPMLPPEVFVYCDPPYLKYGKQWYGTPYGAKDLATLRKTLGPRKGWGMSIDDTPEARQVVSADEVQELPVVYSASSAFYGKARIPKSQELLAFPRRRRLVGGCDGQD